MPALNLEKFRHLIEKAVLLSQSKRGLIGTSKRQTFELSGQKFTTLPVLVRQLLDNFIVKRLPVGL